MKEKMPLTIKETSLPVCLFFSAETLLNIYNVVWQGFLKGACLDFVMCCFLLLYIEGHHPNSPILKVDDTPNGRSPRKDWFSPLCVMI